MKVKLYLTLSSAAEAETDGDDDIEKDHGNYSDGSDDTIITDNLPEDDLEMEMEDSDISDDEP